MSKQIVVYPKNGVVYSGKKVDGISDKCNNMEKNLQIIILDENKSDTALRNSRKLKTV